MAKCIRLRTFERFGQLAVLALLAFCVSFVPPAAAQIHGIPPSVTSIPNHVPPYGVPNIPPSVTSLGPYGYCCQGPSNRPYRNPAFPNRYNRRGNYGYGGYGYTYAVPYYYLYPSDDLDSGGSGGGGPYLYSGPPQGQAPPAEQTLHIVIDSPPVTNAPTEAELADQEAQHPLAKQPVEEPKPGTPTILVFRDGHQQEVTNYAIMGPTVYVFDNRTKKIALADLDVPATVKANDDQGVEFEVPKTKPSSKPTKSGVQSAPDQSPKTGSSTTTTP